MLTPRTCRVTLRPPDLRACSLSSIFLLPGSAGILPACSLSPRSAAILAACGLEARTPSGITHPGPSGHPSREGMIAYSPDLSGYASPTRPADLLSFPHLLTSWERRHLARLFLFSRSAAILAACGLEARTPRGITHPGPSGHPSREGMLTPRTCRVTLRPPDLRTCSFPPSSYFLGARASCPVPFLPGVRPSWPLAGWKPALPGGGSPYSH